MANTEFIPEFIRAHLLEYQLPHVLTLKKALETHGAALDGSDTGTGKTYTAMAVCALMGLRPFPVGPKSVILKWFEIASIFGLVPLGAVNYESLKNGKYYETAGDFNAEDRKDCPWIDIVREPILDPVTGDQLRTKQGIPRCKVTAINWSFPSNTLLIFDEAHKGKNGKSTENSTITSAFMSSFRAAVSLRKRVMCLNLSATISDKIECFATAAYLLGFYKPYMPKFYTRFISTLSNSKTSKKTNGKKEDVFTLLHKKIYPNYGSRMNIKTIKEMSGEEVFRKNDVAAETYEMPVEIAHEIEAQNVRIQAALKIMRRKMIYDGTHPFVIILRARQKIELLKVPKFVELAYGYFGFRNSVVIFVNFNETMKLINDKLLELGVPLELIGTICGGQSGEEREEVVKAFARDEYRILLCNISAGGVSISLHDQRGVFPRVSIISPTWSAIDLQQVLGRIYRAAAKTDAIQRVVYCKKAITDAENGSENGSENSTKNSTKNDTKNGSKNGSPKSGEPEKDNLIQQDRAALYAVQNGMDPREILRLAREDGDLPEELLEKDSLDEGIEEMVCRIVNAKIKNIAVLNDGALADYLNLS